ncbi:molybdenum cofactor guanylyltransferase [Synechococcus sp. CC9616]|uniref:molybdenum cofactor guanylyltransferase n=1 Tax=Synechococcus sp. CC9616 TaxID=110663 RepID=UPI000907422D|nr:molybdenum cofactor guanylyltransferase [Synechococcus sp. CC9616]
MVVIPKHRREVRLSACLLCGGMSRRMGRDKALMPHPRGGVWLTVLLDQLSALALPVVVVSGHADHAEMVRCRDGVSFLQDPRSCNGPLQAMAQVLSPDMNQPVMVLPVDMPRLTTEVLRCLIKVWAMEPQVAAVAHDGEQLQPLLGIYPSGSPFQSTLVSQLKGEEWSWHAWLNCIPYRPVSLPAQALLNANCPEDLAALSDEHV